MTIEVFGKQNCSFCDNAKTLLNRKNLEYTYTDFFTLGEAEQNEVRARAPGAASFPIILLDNVYIGGFDQLNGVLS